MGTLVFTRVFCCPVNVRHISIKAHEKINLVNAVEKSKRSFTFPKKSKVDYPCSDEGTTEES